jgi:hypothetical protein
MLQLHWITLVVLFGALKVGFPLRRSDVHEASGAKGNNHSVFVVAVDEAR